MDHRSISWGMGKWRGTVKKKKAREEDDLQEEEEERGRVGLMGGQRQIRPRSHFVEITE